MPQKMNFQTKFVQDLCTTDTKICEELIQAALNEPIFLQNVQNLRKQSLEALVYMLLMKLRGKLPDTMLSRDKFSLKRIVSLVHQNGLRLQEDSETFRWMLSALTLMVLDETDQQVVQSELETFVNRFDRDLHEIPVYYDVLQTFLILAKEMPELIPIFSRLNGEHMIRRLTSDSKAIRMKSLACLQTLLEFNAHLYRQWLSLLQSPHTIIESKVFLLHQLLETLLRLGDRKAEDILQTLQLDHIWLIVIEGITINDAVCRKETLATVQHAIGYAQQCGVDLIGQYFYWSQDKSTAEALTNAWQSFVTIVEALNESQTHLILPALEMIEKVHPLHVAWKNVLLRLILQHENGRVANYGLNYFLKHHAFDPTELELEKHFLNAFNRAALLENVQETITNLSEYYRTREAFAYLVQTLPEIGWKSVPYYCLVSVIHKFTDELADECKLGMAEMTAMVRSLTSCVKLCHDIKNVPLRYVTFVLLVKSINHFSSPTTDINLLLAIVAEIEKLTTIFSISLEHFQSDDGSTFCDHISDSALMKLLDRINPADTFFVKQVLAYRILDREYIKHEEMLNALIHSNVPVCLKMFQDFPKLVPLLFAKISDIVESTISSVNRGKETGEIISHKTFALLAEIFSLTGSTDMFDKPPLLNEQAELHQHLAELLSDRLECFDYVQSSAKETIQLTHLIAGQSEPTLAYRFFTSVSLKELKECFGRHQTEEPPSIDQLYTMVAEIYLCCRQRWAQSVEMFRTEDDWSKLISLLDVGNIYVLTLVIEILHTDSVKLGPECYDDEIRLTVVDRCYVEILNYRKSDHFMRLMEKFVRMLFHPYVAWKPDTIESEGETISGFVTNYVRLLLEQATTISGLANIVFESMFQLPVELFFDWLGFDKILLQGMIFGDVPKRDQKLESDVIESSGVHIPFKQQSRHLSQADARVRVLCVLVLYRIAGTNHPSAVLFLLKVERMLIERFTQITKAKERYYADSVTHRQKLRIVQALCVILKLTGTQPYPLLNAMLYETNQPNINYLFELIMADSTIDTLTLANALRNEQVKVSGIQSVFVILWLRCCREKALDKQYINLLLPWTMAQNFSTRLYAQITIKKLLGRFAHQDSGPFKQIYDAVNSYLRQGNLERNIERCMKDFRFSSVLDCHNLLTLENVFHNIPKVSGVPEEDVPGTAVLLECLTMHGGCGADKLGHALDFETLPAEKRETLFLAQSVGGTDFVQRKIVPLKSLEPSQDLMLGLPQHLCVKKMDCTDGLIVVASLVNRAPNLGGLARTGEIFAIKQLVINSLQDIGNKEFQALSMTAEKWLNVGELKTHKVLEYLREMKDKGYAVVGAEQTTGSKPIQELQFPKKCILVLGHEKNGLPAEIIRHLDLIGEIPQFGVVRSLNVHVTGAIFMWEYAKQHHVVATE